MPIFLAHCLNLFSLKPMKQKYLLITILLTALLTPTKIFWAASFIPHHLCLKAIPNSGLSQAFICGASLGQNEASFQETLIQLGLIHLIVVSGSHLLFLRKILRFIFPLLKRKHLLETLICFGYAGICWWDPPVTRACFQVLIYRIAKEEKLNLSMNQQILWAGIISLLVFPSWFFSISFCLSWLASLSLCLSRSFARQAVICYFVLTPMIFPLGGLHPFSILSNIFFGPLLGLMLLPISIINILQFNSIPMMNEFEDLFVNLFRKGEQVHSLAEL